jgi:pimeloyl-ACP methyl ester carboxylesterase
VKPADLDVRHVIHQLPGLRMHTVEAGEGPLVVLLHGFPETWWSWRYQLQPLARAGFRVVAPDLRGHGATDQQGPFDLDTLAGDVGHLIEALGTGPRALIVGHDWGGAVAWHLAAHRPQQCEKLAVLNCPHPAAMREALLTHPRWGQVRRSWYMYCFLLPWLPERLLTWNHGEAVVRMLRAASVDRTHFGAEELEPLREAICRPGAAGAMVGWYRTALLGAWQAPPYPVIDRETLLIWGLADPALGYQDLVPGTPRWASRLRVEPLERCGHYVQAEQPERVNALLVDFLAPSAPGAPRPEAPAPGR